MMPSQRNSSSPINCDANGTFGLVPGVCAAVAEGSATWGNPSSIHQAGQRARAVIEEARDAVREIVGAGPRDAVVWTSGATEANNLALRGFAEGALRKVIVSSPFEHPSVLETVRHLGDREGWSVRLLPVSGHELSLEKLAEMTEGAGIISVMLANNETGVIYPIQSIVREIRKVNPSAMIHVDAVQGVSRIPIAMAEWGIDAITLSGHKIGGLQGGGALVLRSGVLLEPEMTGGTQEEGMRAGTQPVAAIYSIHYALRWIASHGGVSGRAARMRANREAFIEGLGKSGGVEPTVSPVIPTVPNTVSLRVPGVAADFLVVAADLHGVLLSSGSACSSGTQRPSPVLLAAGLSQEVARETVRVSVTDDPDTERFYQAGTIVAECIERLKGRALCS
jgi:cysteine desulfurase